LLLSIQKYASSRSGPVVCYLIECRDLWSGGLRFESWCDSFCRWAVSSISSSLCFRQRLLIYVRVLYFSAHRYEHGTFWPNLRQSDHDYVGGCGKARGFNINVPFNKVCLSLCLSNSICCNCICWCLCHFICLTRGYMAVTIKTGCGLVLGHMTRVSYTSRDIHTRQCYCTTTFGCPVPKTRPRDMSIFSWMFTIACCLIIREVRVRVTIWFSSWLVNGFVLSIVVKIDPLVACSFCGKHLKIDRRSCKVFMNYFQYGLLTSALTLLVIGQSKSSVLTVFTGDV